MSLKGYRSVAFESQVKSCGVIEDKCYCVSRAVQANKKEVSRSRCRARSRSWSRFRARRAKSQEAPSSDQGPSLKRDLSLVSLVRTASRTSVRSLVKLFETRWVSLVKLFETRWLSLVKLFETRWVSLVKLFETRWVSLVKLFETRWVSLVKLFETRWVSLVKLFETRWVSLVKLFETRWVSLVKLFETRWVSLVKLFETRWVSLVKLFETRWMNEGRKTQIVLLDERRLDIIIQPKLNSNDLLDLVASHFKLKEKFFFGLGFFDDTNNFNWLQAERRVLDHEFPKKTGLLILHFSIRFYVETIGLLRDSQTVELFYLNARLGVFRGLIECDAEITFELAAHVLQETYGDFVSNDEAKEDLKKLPVIPTNTLKKHPSIAYCEERVIHYYAKLTGTSRGLAIVNYMNIIEKSPTYGIHYYNVKDKKDIPWWLGISPKGIAVYDMNDKTTPRKIFTWKNLENLYYRERKFSIEVHGPKREGSEIHIIHTLSSFNPYEDAVRESAECKDDLSTAISDPTTQVSVSRRTFGASNVDVHAWFASTAQLTKCIWSMAVEQHQFYLDRKQSKGQLPSARSMSEIAAELCSSSTSLPGSTGSDLSRSPSSQSLPSLSNSRYDLSIEQSDSIKAERDMYQALKARKEALEEALRKKTEELKNICFQEGELTGELPIETPLAYGEPPPVFRRRVGTSFTLSVKNVEDVNNLSNERNKLELEVELQGKITSAAQRLASDKTVSKYVHKQRKQSYSKALVKLKEMEKKLAEMHKQVGKSTSSSHHHHTGRVTDGMYNVNDPQSYIDFDPDHINTGHNHEGSAAGHKGLFFRTKSGLRKNSVVSSWISALSAHPHRLVDTDINIGTSRRLVDTDINIGTPRRLVDTDINIGTSRRLVDTDINIGTSLAHSVSFSSNIHSSSSEVRLVNEEDSDSLSVSSDPFLSSNSYLTVTDNPLFRSRSRKHYVVSRSPEQKRFSELVNLVIEQPSMRRNNSNLATIDDDLEDEGSNSLFELNSQTCSTLVLPRQQSFILSKSLRKTVLVRHTKDDVIENACKLFESIFFNSESAENS
ncbi:FERM domain-containing protein 4B [Bulinus truncatus]|nr:FERM domain-containing protein 4B [Bulinus truncatus]